LEGGSFGAWFGGVLKVQPPLHDLSTDKLGVDSIDYMTKRFESLTASGRQPRASTTLKQLHAHTIAQLSAEKWHKENERGEVWRGHQTVMHGLSQTKLGERLQQQLSPMTTYGEEL